MFDGVIPQPIVGGDQNFNIPASRCDGLGKTFRVFCIFMNKPVTPVISHVCGS